jgi:hypothetical protein
MNPLIQGKKVDPLNLQSTNATKSNVTEPAQLNRSTDSETLMELRLHFPAKFGRLIPVILAGLLISDSLAQVEFKDFDVVATSLDANRFPLNPKWGQQVRDNTLPSPKNSCPVDDQDTQHWTSSPQFPKCTSFPVTFNGGWICGHHVNFLPITYKGTVRWNGGPGWFDHDYTFNVTSPGDELYSTAGSQIHVEFDATETVDNWDKTGTWWEKFHHQGVEKGDEEAGIMIDNHSVIVLGLLGMDTQHDAKTEMHPLYAMFVLVGQDFRSRQATWAFFVRNWGNEGYCGDDQENMYTQPIRVQLPHAEGRLPVPTTSSIVSRNVWIGARNTDNLSGINFTAQPNGAGMLLSFSLLTPDNQSWCFGDLTVQDTQTVITNESEEKLPAELEALRAQIDKLPKSSRNELLAQLQSVVPKKGGKRFQPTIIAESTQLGDTHLKPPGIVVPNSDLVRPKKDSVGELNRQKALEVLRKFLAKRRGQVDLPHED